MFNAVRAAVPAPFGIGVVGKVVARMRRNKTGYTRVDLPRHVHGFAHPSHSMSREARKDDITVPPFAQLSRAERLQFVRKLQPGKQS